MQPQAATQNSAFSLDDLQLLAKAGINPDGLADPIQLMSIKNMIKTKGDINADDLAILKLLSRAEFDKDLSSLMLDQKEQSTQNKGIPEGTIRSLNLQCTRKIEIGITNTQLLNCSFESWIHTKNHPGSLASL